MKEITAKHLSIEQFNPPALTDMRKHPRVDFMVTATFTTETSLYTYSQSKNISMSGVFLNTTNPLPIGTLGTLVILLENGDESLEVKGECRVARIITNKGKGPAGMGIEFVNLDSDSSLHLYNIIRYQGGLE